MARVLPVACVRRPREGAVAHAFPPHVCCWTLCGRGPCLGRVRFVTVLLAQLHLVQIAADTDQRGECE